MREQAYRKGKKSPMDRAQMQVWLNQVQKRVRVASLRLTVMMSDM
jgi:hypothetical protein